MNKRRQLARSLEGIVRELRDRAQLPGASPLNRVGLRPYEPQLAVLAARVGDLDRPVTTRGLHLVDELVSHGGSPLYDRPQARAVPETVEVILAALEPR